MDLSSKLPYSCDRSIFDDLTSNQVFDIMNSFIEIVHPKLVFLKINYRELIEKKELFIGYLTVFTVSRKLFREP